MQTGYSGAKGNCPRYVCARAKQLYGTEHGCQSHRRPPAGTGGPGRAVHRPRTGRAGGHRARPSPTPNDHYRQRLAAFELAVERARYDADRARRQYDAVEPENRLVARTLERALEDKLAAARQAEHDLIAQQARRPM